VDSLLKSDFIYLSNSARGCLTRPCDILLLEVEGNYTRVTLTNGTRILLRKPFHVCHARLAPHNFFIVHRGMSVNLNEVKHVEPHIDSKRLLFILTGGQSLTLSRLQSIALRKEYAL
jgi:DNA-binding LytR/AlgR family response regulator